MYTRSTRCTKAPSNLYRSVFSRTLSTTGNALTCAARLGLKPKLISKVANGAQGKSILEELEADGVDTSFIVRGHSAAMWDFRAATEPTKDWNGINQVVLRHG